MKFDMKLITGIFIGVVVGLHMVDTLAVYVPILTVAALVLILRTIHH